MRRVLMLFCAAFLAIPAWAAAGHAQASNSPGGAPATGGSQTTFGGVGGQTGANTGGGAGAGNGTNSGNAGATGGGAAPANQGRNTGVGAGGDTTNERGRHRGDRSPWGWLLVLAVVLVAGVFIAKRAVRRGDARQAS